MTSIKFQCYVILVNWFLSDSSSRTFALQYKLDKTVKNQMYTKNQLAMAGTSSTHCSLEFTFYFCRWIHKRSPFYDTFMNRSSKSYRIQPNSTSTTISRYRNTISIWFRAFMPNGVHLLEYMTHLRIRLARFR